VVATSCQKKQLRHTSMLVSTRQVMLRTILRLSANSLKEAFADNFTAPQVLRYCVLCDDAHRIQMLFDLRNASGTLVCSSAPCRKGDSSMIVNAPTLWMHFMHQTSWKILSKPLDCCQETGSSKELGEWQVHPCCTCVHLLASRSRLQYCSSLEPGACLP
jgi:hypothetical protein